MAKSKNKTTKPSGLSITRNGNTYTCKWKIGAKNYGAGQKCQYTKNGKTWTNYTVGATATSFTLTDANLTYLAFRVQGCQKKYKKGGKTVKPTWSDWAQSTAWTATNPNKPTLEYESVSANSGTFTWKVTTSNNDRAIFDNVVVQKQLRRDNEVNPTTGTWVAVSGSAASGSVTITEEPEDLTAGAFVRWVRVKSHGNKGDSAWTYASHAYGAAAEANLIEASAETKGSFTQITAKYSTSHSRMNPIDSLVVEYAIGIPTDTDLSAPASGWADAIELRAAQNEDTIVVNVSDAIGMDECLWVRVKTTHDEVPSYSNALLAQIGTLKTPTINAVPNFTAGTAAITITEETSCNIAKTAIFYRSEADPSNDQIVAVFARGTTTGTISVPDLVGKTKSCFGAYAFVGANDGLIIDPKMRSESVVDSDIAAVAPDNVVITEGPRDETVRIGWEWTWEDALSAELAWSEYPEAWESTDEPSTYKVEDRNAVNWVIAGLEVGKRWYFRVRLIGEADGEDLIGPWSPTVSYELLSVPDRPVLTLSKDVINEDGTVTARWAYSISGTTEQAYAEIAIVTKEDDTTVYTPIAHTDVSSSLDLDYDWQTGETYNLAVRITTTSGMQSVWSDPVGLYVAEPVTITMTASNILCGGSYTERDKDQINTYVDGVMTNIRLNDTQNVVNVPGGMTSELYDLYNSGGGVTTVTRVDIDEHTYEIHKNTKTYAFTSDPYIWIMPFTATITGAGATGTTILSIVRAEDYHLYRPDDKDYDGYEGETIATFSQIGEAAITITVEDLVGRLDDGARYKLIATVIDDYGQTASVEYLFMVNWTHKATAPNATVIVDKYQRIAKITPIAVTGIAANDTCDIYRITADQPELIYKSATFGETYVDPYPAFGDFCGHRIVTVTANGDYASYSGLAWYDTDSDDGDLLEEQQMIIDVDGEQIELPYNITLRNKWTKDFKRTSYLGGSVRGDWNPAVTRDLTAETVTVRGDEIDKQLAMRGLAGYAGVAHIRTPDGSSLTCDIQIDEAQAYNTKKVSYTLTIMAIDPGEPVGMTLTEWEAMHELE